MAGLLVFLLLLLPWGILQRCRSWSVSVRPAKRENLDVTGIDKRVHIWGLFCIYNDEHLPQSKIWYEINLVFSTVFRMLHLFGNICSTSDFYHIYCCLFYQLLSNVMRLFSSCNTCYHFKGCQRSFLRNESWSRRRIHFTWSLLSFQ